MMRSMPRAVQWSTHLTAEAESPSVRLTAIAKSCSLARNVKRSHGLLTTPKLTREASRKGAKLANGSQARAASNIHRRGHAFMEHFGTRSSAFLCVPLRTEEEGRYLN